jgi:hypothetical protein
MAKSPIIEFKSFRDPKGYRLVETPEGAWIVRKGRKDDPLEPWRPLDRTADLFLIFAKSANTLDGLLNFVQEFGPVRHNGQSSLGEPATDAIHAAKQMESLLQKHWREPSMAKRRQADLPPFISPARWTRDRELSPAYLSATVVWDFTTNTLQWQFRPNTLLDGLWLQLGMFLMRGAKLMVCEHCGLFFTAGIGTGRRVVARFCSDEHRIAHNSEKRSSKSSEQPRRGGRK